MVKYIIYGKDNCPNCDKAELLLKFKNLPYEKKIFGVDYDLQELHDVANAPIREVPYIITICDEHGAGQIGNADALIAHLRK